MDNDKNTLDGALMELGELLTNNLKKVGIKNISYIDGLTTLVNKITGIDTTTGSKLEIYVPSDIECGDLFKITGNLKDYNDNAIRGAIITLFINGLFNEETLTKDNGDYEFNLILDNIGLYIFHTQYNGEENMYFECKSEVINRSIQQGDSLITIKKPLKNERVGLPVKVEGLLTNKDSPQKPLANKTVKIKTDETTFINIISPNDSVHNPVLIEGELIGEFDEKITGKKINIKITGGDEVMSKELITDDNGIFKTELDDIGMGSHILQVEFEGDGTHKGATATVPFTVERINTDFWFNVPQDGTEVYDPITVNGVLVTTTGDDYDNLANKPVEIRLIKEGADPLVMPCNTDEFGMINEEFTGLTAGADYTISVIFEGDETYNSCTKSVMVHIAGTIERESSYIQITSPTGDNTYQPFNFTGILHNESTDEPISDKEINIIAKNLDTNNTENYKVTTNDDGEFNQEIDNLDAGNYFIIAMFNLTDEYESCFSMISIELIKREININLIEPVGNTSQCVANFPISCEVTTVDDNQPVPNLKIYAMNGRGVISSIVTDSEGKVNGRFDLSSGNIETMKNNNFYLSFGEDAHYKSKKSNNVLVFVLDNSRRFNLIKPFNITQKIIVGNKFEIVGELFGADESKIPGVDVNVVIKYSNTEEIIDTINGETNGEGNFIQVVDTSNLSYGDYDVLVTVLGHNQYCNISKMFQIEKIDTTTKIEINEPADNSIVSSPFNIRGVLYCKNGEDYVPLPDKKLTGYLFKIGEEGIHKTLHLQTNENAEFIANDYELDGGEYALQVTFDKDELYDDLTKNISFNVKHKTYLTIDSPVDQSNVHMPFNITGKLRTKYNQAVANSTVHLKIQDRSTTYDNIDVITNEQGVFNQEINHSIAQLVTGNGTITAQFRGNDNYEASEDVVVNVNID